MPDTQTCPACGITTDTDAIVEHITDHLSLVAAALVITEQQQQTQAATIRNMSADVESQQATLNTLRLAHEAATREIATLRQTVKRLEVEGVTAKSARAHAENEAAALYDSLQRAVDRIAGLEAERDQALEEVAAAKQAHQNGATLMRNQQYNLVAQYNETAVRSRAWYEELQATRKQLAQVLELVAGARLAVVEALAIGEQEYKINTDRPLSPVGSWADDPAYLSVEANGRWINRYLLEMEPGTLYPPATGRHDTTNPLSVTTCPACKANSLQCFINEHEQGYIVCTQCHQQIATLWPVGAYNNTAEAREALATQPTTDDPNWPY